MPSDNVSINKGRCIMIKLCPIFYAAIIVRGNREIAYDSQKRDALDRIDAAEATCRLNDCAWYHEMDKRCGLMDIGE